MICPASCNWTGFYIGGNLGYAHGDEDTDMTLSGEFLNGDTPAELLRAIDDAGDRGLDADAFAVGGFVGYNYQIRQFVIGVEADGDYMNLRDSSLDHVPNSFNTVRTSFKSHYLFTAGPRLGLSFGKFLVYATGGVAVGDLDAEQELVFSAPNINHDEETNHIDEARVGWMVGGGLEYMISCHWTARIDYRYSDLGCADRENRDEFGPNFVVGHEACLATHSATFGLAFKF